MYSDDKHRYTGSAAAALRLARSRADRSKSPYVGTEHLLLGLVSEADGAAGTVLREKGADPEKLGSLIGQLIRSEESETQQKPEGYSPRAEEILENAAAQAEELGVEQVGTEHILLAILEDVDCVATRLLHTMGIDVAALYRTLLDIAGAPPERSRDLGVSVRAGAGQSGSAAGALERYSTDLTQRAADGKIDEIVGREAETDRLMQILTRRTKNNPCLIGEPGVGKTAIVEGLAQRIVRGDVPPILAGKRLITLDMAGMVAGSKYRGEFEERMKQVLDEVMRSRDVLLFMDEIHTLIGAGGAEGSLDASNIMKPFLSRGQIQLIGATTITEYRKYIEKDAALERRFQPVMVEEPSEQQTIDILKGLRPAYEKHHRVTIRDEALESAAALSKRYINDRYLPDKAIDLLDESCARRQMNVYREQRTDDAEEERYQELTEALEQAISDGDLAQASSLHEQLLKLEQQQASGLARKRKRLEKDKPEVTTADIAATVALWTGIPVQRVAQAEGKRLLALDKELHRRVIGQDEAVSAVARAIRRGRTGLKDPRRPIGSFLFLGPTGVGKTELSKALAQTVFGSEQSMIRVDMSEYMEKHSVSRLVGSPPGYVGYEEGGQLSEQVRRHPYSVILFDEIEKAHPDVFNILLQVLDEGHITDAQGRRVDFKNTILIMTSNAGAAAIQNPKRLGFGAGKDAAADYARMKEGIMETVKQTFKPEFLNRIDDTIVFQTLTKEDIHRIVELQIRELSVRCQSQMNISLKVRTRVVDEIARTGYDEKYGARPLKRAIQTRIEDPLAEEILSGRAAEGGSVTVTMRGGKIVFDVMDND